MIEELRKLLRAAVKPDDAARHEYANHPIYRLGYAAGFSDGVDEAIGIAEEELGE